MKPLAASLVVLVLLVGFAERAHAEESLRERLLGPVREPVPPPVSALEQAKVLKRHGVTLTILSMLHLAVGGAVGISFAVMAHQCSREPGCSTEFAGPLFLGTSGALTVIGGSMAAIGIPMWVLGVRREQAESVRLSASTSGLRVTF